MSFQKYPYYLGSIWKLLTSIKPAGKILRAFLRPAAARSMTIQLRENGLQFKVRGVMDIWSVKETYLDRFYEKFGAKIQPGWTVVDIGGGIGDFSIFAALPGNNFV